MSELFNLQNVPIFSAGTWNNDVYNEADLDAIAAAYGQVGFKPPLKLGHDESQPLAKSDGMPALGWVARLRRVGKVLYADFKDMPKQIWDAVRRKAYNRVSAEIYWDYEEGGRRLPRVLKAVALLGAEIPAVTSLGALESLYDATGKPFKRYDYPMPMMGGPGAPPTVASPATEVASYEPPGMKKAKDTVNYRPADEGGYDRCGACRFFEGPIDAQGDDDYVGNCCLVEGEVATTFVCDLLEVRDAFQAASRDARARTYMVDMTVEAMDGMHCVMKGGEKVKCFPSRAEADAHMAELGRAKTMALQKTYIIEKRGDKWCLIAKSTGETLGCHSTEGEAQAQERAVQASKNATEEHVVVRFTQDEMRKLCPACADHMRFLNLREYKVTYDPVAKTYAGFSQGLCDKFSPGDGFRTRCMDSSMGANATDPGAMCNALETWCFDNGYLASKTAQAQVAKTHERDAHAGEDGAMTDEEKKQLEALQTKVTELTAALEAANTTNAKTLTETQAQLKTYESQLAAAEADRAKAAEIQRRTENTAWLDQMCRADALRMLPVEREYAAHLLDVLTAGPGTQLKAYSQTVKGKNGAGDKTEEIPTVVAFKRLFEIRGPNTAFFSELATGGLKSAELARDAEPPASLAEARERLVERAKEYIAAQVKKGDKPASLRDAMRIILDTDPELKEAAGGVRPEGVQKAADGAARFSRIVAKKADAKE